MKRTKVMVALLLVLCVALPVAAQESFFEKLQYSLSVDAAFYPLTTRVAGNGDTFSPITGAYSGLEGRVTGKANYRIDTPLGESWLVSGANVVLGASAELTPVSVKNELSATFTPVPFLVFSSGVQAGKGWDVGTLFVGGMSKLNTTTWKYEPLTGFGNWFLKAWFQGTFQFDLAAVVPGDWNHLVTQASYQIYWNKMSGVADGDIWSWQLTGNTVNGWKQYCNFVLAYQMPLVLKMAGVLVETDKYLSATAYDQNLYANYKGDFASISISPLFQFQFGEKDSLALLIGFSSRRRFAETYDYDNWQKEPTYTCTGREWYFNRVALSYSHSF